MGVGEEEQEILEDFNSTLSRVCRFLKGEDEEKEEEEKEKAKKDIF